MWQLNGHKRIPLLFANELQSKPPLALALSPVSSAQTISQKANSHSSCVSTVSPRSPTIAACSPLPKANPRFLWGPVVNATHCKPQEGGNPALLLPLTLLRGCAGSLHGHSGSRGKELRYCVGARASLNMTWGLTSSLHYPFTLIPV